MPDPMISSIFLPIAMVIYGSLLAYMLDKLVARLQHRRGPLLVVPRNLRGLLGNTRVFQHLYDIAKLLQKETIVPEGFRKSLFVSAPILALASSILAVLTLVVYPVYGILSYHEYSVFIALTSSFLVSVFWLLGGLASPSPWALVAARREKELMLISELLIVAGAYSAAVAFRSLSVFEIYEAQRVPLLFLNPLAAITFVVGMIGKLCLRPFDIPEAEQEVASGIFTEYSGKLLALIEATRLIFLSFYTLLFLDLFLGKAVSPLDAIIPFILVMVLAFVSSITPRIRIDQAQRILYVLGVPMAVSSLTLAYFV